jgi:hypothetical protein
MKGAFKKLGLLEQLDRAGYFFMSLDDSLTG